MGAWEKGGGPLGTLEWGQLLLPGSNSRSALGWSPRAKAGGLPGRGWAGYRGYAFLWTVVPGVAEVGGRYLRAEWQNWPSRRALLSPQATGPRPSEHQACPGPHPTLT